MGELALRGKLLARDVEPALDLLAVPKYGRVKVNRILTHCRISPSKTIGGLSERQRNELVSYLRR